MTRAELIRLRKGTLITRAVKARRCQKTAHAGPLFSAMSKAELADWLIKEGAA